MYVDRLMVTILSQKSGTEAFLRTVRKKGMWAASASSPILAKQICS